MILANKLKDTSGVEKLYVDDVFSAYTYTGNGSSNTITTGVDIWSGTNEGLIWLKARDSDPNGSGNKLFDTVRGGVDGLRYSLSTDVTIQQVDEDYGTISSTGFYLGSQYTANYSGTNYVSWTFRKAPKFFDVVTYTGNGASEQTIVHSLGTTPGMIIIKKVSGNGSWGVWHRSLTSGHIIYLELTNASAYDGFMDGSAAPTSTTFTAEVASGTGYNTNGATYVAYLFAHDTATDGIIKCGSFTTDGSGNATVSLGWEPQFVITKGSSVTSDWVMVDQSRSWPNNSFGPQQLLSNSSDAEISFDGTYYPTATGFCIADQFASSQTYIYLAIRRPNKPPTLGTQVYNAIARTGTGAAATVTGVGFAPDLISNIKRGGSTSSMWVDRLRGSPARLQLQMTTAEDAQATAVTSITMDGMTIGNSVLLNSSGLLYINHFFKRAVGVFDVVCYTGTGVAKTEAHGLGVVPELMIVKSRSTSVQNWQVYVSGFLVTQFINLDLSNGTTTSALYPRWSQLPTTSAFGVSDNNSVNQSTITYIAYLFATKAGISKVGSYTGNGSSQTINCTFTTGARFILIKRTDAAGDWFVFDTARGVVTGNDPHLSLNTTAAEVTSNDSIDPESTGFIVNQVAATNINVTSATYIYLAMA